VGVSAGYAPLTQGTESIGFLVMPGSRVGLYTFKPALNAVNMDGVFKGSVELDAVGGLARSTADLALLSQIALTEEKRNLLSQEGYQKFLAKTFDSLRIGFLDPTKWSPHPDIVQLDEHILKQMVRFPILFVWSKLTIMENELYFAAIERIKSHATKAFVAYPVDILPATDLWYEGQNPIDVVMCR
jgi:amidase